MRQPRKANPLRPGHLRVARLRLGLTQERVGVLAGYPVANAQSTVSAAELTRLDTAGVQCKQRIMRALLHVVKERRAERWMADHLKRELAEDLERIARQEALWNAVPDSPAKEALLDAMIDRCFDLMCSGDGSQCDAIAEWLPPDRVQAMFAAWEQWAHGETNETSTPHASPEAADTQTECLPP